MEDSIPVRTGRPHATARWRLIRGLHVALLSALLVQGCRFPWQDAAPSDTLVLSGTVDARQVDLSFQAGGRIARLLVDEGQAVQPGQPVAELDPADLQLGAERARAQAAASAALRTRSS
jgi:HlyD family secretion protein